MSSRHENNMNNTNNQQKGFFAAKMFKCFLTMFLMCMENVKAFFAQQQKQIPTKFVCKFKTQTSSADTVSSWISIRIFMKKKPSDLNHAENSSLSMSTNKNQCTDRSASAAGQFLFIRKTNKSFLTKTVLSSSIMTNFCTLREYTTTAATALSMASYIGDFESASSNTFVNPAPFGAFKSWYNVMEPLSKTPVYDNELREDCTFTSPIDNWPTMMTSEEENGPSSFDEVSSVSPKNSSLENTQHSCRHPIRAVRRFVSDKLVPVLSCVFY
mmetsp:Transcript_35661/g.52308  ORF Transcript_35661/g.52308 Transcript_35661/m.52308 type:complete len:270 (+) Transcript_35661:109-918(+)